MIKINYGTDAFYSENIGDKYYCKTFTSAKQKLKELLEEYNNENKKDILKEYDKWVFDKRSCFSVGNCNIGMGILHIHIEEIILD